MRAIIFSNYDVKEFNEHWKPRLEAHDIEIYRVKSMVRHSGRVDLSNYTNVPLVIAISGIMSKDQRDRVKEAAKTAGKTYFDVNPLAGEVSWQQLDAVKNKSVAVASPPMKMVSGDFSAPLRLVPPPESTPTPPEPAPVSEPEIPSIEPDYKMELETAGELLSEAEERVSELMSERDAQKRANIALASQLEREKKALELANKDKLELGREVEKLTTQVKKLSDDLIEYGVELETLRNKPKTTVHVLDDLFKSLDALKVLVRQGIMTADEAFEKLANFKPKS